jgi:hypothetical protein
MPNLNEDTNNDVIHVFSQFSRPKHKSKHKSKTKSTTGSTTKSTGSTTSRTNTPEVDVESFYPSLPLNPRNQTQPTVLVTSNPSIQTKSKAQITSNPSFCPNPQSTASAQSKLPPQPRLKSPSKSDDYANLTIERARSSNRPSTRSSTRSISVASDFRDVPPERTLSPELGTPSPLKKRRKRRNQIRGSSFEDSQLQPPDLGHSYPHSPAQANDDEDGGVRLQQELSGLSPF